MLAIIKQEKTKVISLLTTWENTVLKYIEKKIATVKSNKPVYCKGNTTMGKPESLKFD